MEIKYNVTGARRKEMTKVISKALDGWEIRYLGVPSCSYQVGDFEITRTGTLLFSDRTDSEEVETVLEALAKAGFECEPAEDTGTNEECESAENNTEANEEYEPQEVVTENEEVNRVDKLTISLPNNLDEHAKRNLDDVIRGKATLFKAAFLTEDLSYTADAEKLTFPWFSYTSQASIGEDTNAYMLFLTHLIRYVKEVKRVTAKDKAVDNPRYAFRCFLLRLGFIGQEYKTVRKILLRNLSGSGAFKNGHRKADEDEISE